MSEHLAGDGPLVPSELIWSFARLGEGIGRLASEAGTILRPSRYPLSPPELPLPAERRRFVAAAADWLGVEAAPVTLEYDGLEGQLRGAAPLVLELPHGSAGGVGYLALLAVARGRVVVLGPAGHRHELPLASVAALLRAPEQASCADEIDRLLAMARVPEERKDRVRHALLAERLGTTSIATAWLLRLPPSAPMLEQARASGLVGLLCRYLAVYVPKTVLWLLAWWVLWRGALAGRVDWGWLTAWVLLLFTNVPFRLVERWYANLFSVRLGWLLKRRLLEGALRLEPDEIRHQGTGMLLGRVLESEAAENLSLDAGVMAMAASIDTVLSLVILAQGSGGVLHAVLLLAWIALAFPLVREYYRRHEAWSGLRLESTHALVEQMVGHPTRLVQERLENRHADEDTALESYVERSRRLDSSAALVRALVPGGWLASSLVLLAPTIVAGGFSTSRLALAVGGMFFALLGLERLTTALLQAAEAGVVWRKILPLFRAARRQRVRGLPEVALTKARCAQEVSGKRPILEAVGLTFGYRERGEPAVSDCDLEMKQGDRVLIEGPSGGGKSTLLSLILGLRPPDAGLLLLHGLDHASLGDEGWRQQVAVTPQFHENHVFLGTFAFNLLLGREWPPERESWEEMQAVCRELGLEDLLQRMPGGLLQPVGETGWQLSHGERSRLFIARALLQPAELVAFDESFAALDPETLERVLQAVLARVPTLLVVAHP